MLRRYVRPEGLAIVSVPNVAHLTVRLPLLFGRFDYREEGRGVLEWDHVRFFTFASARQLVESSGFTVECVTAGSDVFGCFLHRAPALGRFLRGLLAFGIVIVGRRTE